jgi:hypothetical protein
MASVLGALLDSVLQLPGKFLAVALSDPLSALLIVIGGLLTTASVAAFGLLSLGAIVDLVRPARIGRSHPP